MPQLIPTPVNCWPSPSNDGTCEVSIEYELENDTVTLYDVIISIPLPWVVYLPFLSVVLNFYLVMAPIQLSRLIPANGLWIARLTHWHGASQSSLLQTTVRLVPLYLTWEVQMWGFSSLSKSLLLAKAAWRVWRLLPLTNWTAPNPQNFLWIPLFLRTSIWLFRGRSRFLKLRLQHRSPSLGKALLDLYSKAVLFASPKDPIPYLGPW